MQEPKIPGGYILLSRKIIESEIWNKPPLYLKVWVYILSKAQHKPYNNLDRGQAFISIPELIEVCSYKVGYRTEKPTKKQIYGILEWLRNPNEGVNGSNCEGNMIETTKVTHGMLVEVNNYNVYQDPRNYESNNEGQAEGTTKEQRKDNKGNNKYKNVKNDKNDNNKYSAEFEEFWSYYPRKVDKPKAYKSFKTKFKKHSLETLIDGAKRYSEYVKRIGTDTKYIKHGSTFLNNDSFLDEYAEDIKQKGEINLEEFDLDD
jgi:hypothetical protein